MSISFETIEQTLSLWMRQACAAVFPGADLAALPLNVVATTDASFGDYQCNAAMSVAKLLKMKPRDVAQAIVDRAGCPVGVERIEIAGPGFLNFHLSADWLARRLEAVQTDARLGVPAAGQGKTVILDYSSPNVAKPMHIGHIRSTVIGNALDRLHRFLGWRVLADNHLGDWGTQFGLLMLGFRTFADPTAYEASPIEELERVYVASYNRSKEDENWKNAARAELVKLQQGDAENRELWRSFIEHSLREFERIYQRLNVKFDLVRGESFYNDKLPGVIVMLQENGLAEESDGALIIKLEAEKLTPCIVRKSDGGYNYATTDIATVLNRAEEFKPDAVIYVTDERQQLHFKQFFTVCRKLGVTTRLEHIWFGLMRLPEGTFSTREGNVIKLDRLLDEAESRALALVQQSSPDMPPAQQREVARCVGLGAVKYADLSQNPQSLVTFTWDKALALDGNSAPYLQYAYARIASVQDKYRERFPVGDPLAQPIQLADPLERALAVKLLRFPDIVLRAAANFRPNQLADYLFDLAQTYSTFYQNVPFLKAEAGVRESRVRLCDITAKTLRCGLNLLGIETPDRI
ncbi:MAG: arginine--tRNA ligase [Verrucomicrobia bacterium]|nr:MAG: arginine--tRNA ligase [Verrucomicrobiota bacterium]